VAPQASPRRFWRFAAAAAVLVSAMIAGYAAGQRRAVNGLVAAPDPTRIVQTTAAWQPMPRAGAQ
jgi:hypothetical protein